MPRQPPFTFSFGGLTCTCAVLLVAFWMIIFVPLIVIGSIVAFFQGGGCA